MEPIDRRRLLTLIGAAGGAGLLAACGDSSALTTVFDSTTSAPTTSTTTSSSAAAGSPIPTETQGPYPADGSNGPNVLTDGAIVRQDLTTSFGSLSGTATGAPTRILLTVVDASNGAPLPGAAVYLWHCTSTGRYSIYEETDQNYLRGVQVADDAGRITFDTVFPGCYSGRWPHCHFEVFDDLATADAGRAARKVSQLALPAADCRVVYADPAYGNSSGNLERLSLERDMVFADGWSDQLATVSGSATDGWDVSLLVRV